MKKLIIILSIFLASCGGGSGSSAQGEPNLNSNLSYVRVVVVKCQDRCLPTDKALEVVAVMQDFYKKNFARDVYVSRVDEIQVNFKAETLQNFGNATRYFQMRDYLKSKGMLGDRKKREAVLVFDQYVKDDTNDLGFMYFGGYSGICYVGQDKKNDKDDISVVYIGYNPKTNPRAHLDSAASIASHEFGHALGAWHIEEYKQFMFPTLYEANMLDEQVSHITQKEINTCTTRRAYLAYKNCLTKSKPKLCMKKHGVRNNTINKPEVFGAIK